jgi:hypothetical protein
VGKHLKLKVVDKMAEYIDRELLLKDLETSIVVSGRNDVAPLELRGVHKVINRIKSMPTEDVVPVVRCKDCKYFDVDEEDELGECKCGYITVSYNGALYPHRTDFCSYGERKADNGKL